MIISLIKENLISREKEMELYSFFFAYICLLLSMKSKKITPWQNYFLIHHLQSFSRYKDNNKAAYFCTDLMASLEKETTFMDFLNYSTPMKRNIAKRLKKKLIIDVIMFILLSDTDDGVRQTNLSYVHYIAQDIGIKSAFSFNVLLWRAEKKISQFSSPPNLEDFDEAFKILEDALYRSNLIT